MKKCIATCRFINYEMEIPLSLRSIGMTQEECVIMNVERDFSVPELNQHTIR